MIFSWIPIYLEIRALKKLNFENKSGYQYLDWLKKSHYLHVILDNFDDYIIYCFNNMSIEVFSYLDLIGLIYIKFPNYFIFSNNS